MPKKQEDSRPGIKQEALAVLGFFLALFILVSLISHSFSSGSNWCGRIGEIVAKSLMGFVGYGSYFFVVLIIVSSVFTLLGQSSFKRIPELFLGLSAGVISFCGMISSLAIIDPILSSLGGFVGNFIYDLLYRVVGGVGTFLVLGLVLLISFMLVFKFSPYQFCIFVGKMIRFSVSKCRSSLGSFRENKTDNCEIIKSSRRRRIKNKIIQDSEEVLKVGHSKSQPVVQELATKKEKTVDDEFATKLIARGDWKLPPLGLLEQNANKIIKIDKSVYYKISEELEAQLNNFGVKGKVVGIAPGPVVTTYEYAPAPGVKISKIVGLADDLALGLKAKSVRVVGSIPGKAALGIEIPNVDRNIVYIRDLISAEDYRNNANKLSIALGLDVVGVLSMANLAKMPHLLIAGATGAGKSVGINTIIASILYNATPEEVRFLMIDPKRIELSGYEGIPHLLHPVVVEPKMASRALNWAVKEMERRYKLLEEARVKSFDSYNEKVEGEKLPYIVIIVDELADLMMVASKDVEAAIARLAQMARAAGMHIILATQRPSVDVLTGLIKANFPTRISFKVSSKIDSRTILDSGGAEQLLGAGDMLFLAPGTSDITRIHGAYISEKETAAIVDFLKEQGESNYDATVVEQIEKEEDPESEGSAKEDYDELYDKAVAFVTETGHASISSVQRRLRVGYNRAARMIEVMEKEGLIGPADGSKPREVLVRNDYS
ncbi:MAG: DNA translocase FtsK 4TM domain-containing protein [Desulfotalea sp.]